MWGLVGTPSHYMYGVFSYYYWTPSDETLKKNINPIKYGLNELMKIKPVQYHWKKQRGDKETLGFLAQELADLIPEIVLEPKDESANYAVSYKELIPVLVNAIQEQQYLIEQLREDLDRLK